jgi:integrase
MPKAGRHPKDALTATKVRSLKVPGRYADGNGLYLFVDKNSSKRWVLRTVIAGSRTDIGLGSERLVTLAEARDEARRLRKIARDGGDPLAEKRQEKAQAITFDAAAKTVHEFHSADWKNPKHRQQWINTLNTYASPVFGAKRIGEVRSDDVVDALMPIWKAKPETARRVLQRIGTVMDWARGKRFYLGENPVDAARIALGKQPRRETHFAAMPYADVPAFYRSIPDLDTHPSTKLALQLVILTAVRTTEARLAAPDEFDLEECVWTIPGERMKAGKEQRIPLIPEAVAIIREALETSTDKDLLFPGSKPGRPMSNMTLLAVLRRAGLPFAVHGFRSSFKDWATEETSFPDELSEMALAHTIRNKTKAAYKRGDLFERRKKLMQAWANYLTTSSANVVPLSKAAG